MKLKPGHTTTEFWTTLGIALADIALASLGKIDGTTAAVAATVITGLYAGARTLLKLANP